jgi:integrase
MARRGDGIYRRGRTWLLDCWINGTRHVERLGKGITRTTARELAQVKRAAILKGEAGIGRKRKDVLFDKAAEEFLRWAEANKRPKTARCYGEFLRPLLASFAGKRLSELHPFLIEKHKRARLEAGAPVMANRELSVLKNLFNRAREWGWFEGENPVLKVRGVKEPRGRLRYLEVDEEAELLAAAREPLRTIILSGIHAALRVRAEALTLRKPDVDLRQRPLAAPHGLLTVQASFAKTGQTRTVPLNSTLREALEPFMGNGSGEYVFVTRAGRPLRSIRSAFQTACRRAGLKGVTPHVLRHTFASRMAMAGVDLRTIQELGGWKSLTMVERYAHPSPSHRAAAVERIAAGNFPTCSQHQPRRRLAYVG